MYFGAEATHPSTAGIMSRGLLSLLFTAMAISAMGGVGVSASSPDAAGPSSAAADSTTTPRPLPFSYDLYTFRGADPTSTAVVAAFAVSVGRLERKRVDRQVLYRFDVTLVLSDTALHSVSRSDDSVYVAVPRALSRNHLLFTHVEVEAPPSVATLQRVIMTDASTPGIGQLYTTPFPIPDYSGTELMLSDVAMGQPEPTAGWTRGDVTLALLPTSQFPGSSFDLFYEIYNLPNGHAYATEIAIEEVDGLGIALADEPNAVLTRFSGESTAGPDGTLPELRHVEASLGDGRYRITVTVTDEVTGRSATQSRFFEVNQRGRGATMVPALPAKRTLGQ